MRRKKITGDVRPPIIRITVHLRIPNSISNVQKKMHWTVSYPISSKQNICLIGLSGWLESSLCTRHKAFFSRRCSYQTCNDHIHVAQDISSYQVNIYEPGHSISYKIACTISEDSDQPAYPRSLIRVVSVDMKTLGLDIDADAQADLSFRWAHMRYCRKCWPGSYFIFHHETVGLRYSL